MCLAWMAKGLRRAPPRIHAAQYGRRRPADARRYRSTIGIAQLTGLIFTVSSPARPWANMETRVRGDA